MLQNFLFPNARFIKQCRLLLCRHGLFLPMLLVLVAGSASPVQTARAKPAFAWSYAEIDVFPGGDLTLCKGETKYVNVYLSVNTYRLFGGVGGSRSRPPNQLIQANSSNSQVGSVSPGSRLTQLGQPHSSGYVPAYTTFYIKAADVGSTLLTFSDGGNMFTGSAPDRPRADPEFLTVTVKECVFEVTAISKWQIPEGFKPILTSQFSWVVRPDQDGKFDESNILVRNSAVLGEHYFASGYTTEQIKAYASTVRVYGKVHWDVSKIELVFSYEPVKGRMDLDCPGCLRPVHGESTGFGTPYSEVVIGPTSGFSKTKPHVLEYLNRFGNLATTTGTLNITVVRIYR